VAPLGHVLHLVRGNYIYIYMPQVCVSKRALLCFLFYSCQPRLLLYSIDVYPSPYLSVASLSFVFLGTQARRVVGLIWCLVLGIGERLEGGRW